MPKQYVARAIMRVSYTYISLLITCSWLQHALEYKATKVGHFSILSQVLISNYWRIMVRVCGCSVVVVRCSGSVVRCRKDCGQGPLKCKPALYKPHTCTKRASKRMLYICNRKLWLSVGGAFSQLLAHSGYKRKLPWARNLISQCCWSFCGNFKCWTGRKKNSQLTFKIATKPSVTSGTTRIERNRSKLGVEIHSSQTKALCRM